jgi:hypothetical protein
MNEDNAVKHKPRVLYRPVISSGRRGRAPTLQVHFLIIAAMHRQWTIVSKAMPLRYLAVGIYHEKRDFR